MQSDTISDAGSEGQSLIETSRGPWNKRSATKVTFSSILLLLTQAVHTMDAAAATKRRARRAAWLMLALSIVCHRPIQAEETRGLRPNLNPISLVGQNAFATLVPKRTTILILGVDNASPSTKHANRTRSDTTLLCTFSPTARKISLISIPRDSRVKIPGYGQGKVNAAYTYGGPELAKKTISSAFNIPVDHYAVIDTSALRAMIDLIGPVEMEIPHRMRYTDQTGKLYIDLKPGKQMLNASQVEQYVRFRQTPDADIGRIQRQHALLKAIYKKLADPAQSLTRLPSLVINLGRYVKTDLSMEQMAKLTLFGMGLKESDISMASLPGRAANIQRVSYWIVNNAKAQSMLAGLREPNA